MRRLLLPLAFLALATAAVAQNPSNVLVVVNEASPVSIDVGQYYAQKRSIPKDQVVRIKAATQESIDRQDYLRQIEAPIAQWIVRQSAHDRILYIVLTKGVPIRVSGTSGPTGTVASVDSELALLYRRMTGAGVTVEGRSPNPYFLADSRISTAKPFSHEDLDIFLVTRLDGFTFADVRGVIDRGAAPVKEGRILLDRKEGLADKGNTWLQSAADYLQAMGFGDRVVLDASAKVLTGLQGVLGYYSWGSNDHAIKIRHFDLGFAPGALAGMFVSSDGRTFNEPPADWKAGGTWEDKSTHYAGSPQSLIGDLIRDGVTGAAGHVAEPYLEGTIRPDILFPAYLSGFNLAESYYLAMPYLSWQTVVIGDPLCAPFRTQQLTQQQADPGINPETELPAHFSTRRVRLTAAAAYRDARIHPDVVKMMLRAETRIAKDDKQGARQVLEEVTQRDPRVNSAQLLLASLYEQSGDYDRAVERYKVLLETAPNNAIVLNNLAYATAVHYKQPQQAVAMAEKAFAQAKNNPNIADTLGWIYHLVGRNDEAAKLLADAARAAGQNADIQLHAAAVHASIGKTDEAKKYFARALELNAEIASREEAVALKEKLK